MFDSSVTEEMIQSEAEVLGFDLWITVSQGLRGHFAVLMGEEGPIESSPCAFTDRENAIADARRWSATEQVPVLLGA